MMNRSIVISYQLSDFRNNVKVVKIFSNSYTYRCQKVFQHQWAASQHKSSKLDILHSTCTIGRLTPVELNANFAN